MKLSIPELEDFMQAAQIEISNLRIVKRSPTRYPFDSVAEETLSKVFALIRSAILLIRNHQAEEAFGLARSVVECAMNLRWITADRSLIAEHSFLFVRYGKDIKSFWYWWVKARFAGKQQADDADRYAAEWGLIEDASGAFKHWSGLKQFTRAATELQHPIVGNDMSREDLAAKRAIDYFHPSCFVHCSQPGLDSYFSEDQFFDIRRASSIGADYESRVLWICNLYLHEILIYALNGMNVYLYEPLKCLANHKFDESSEQFQFGADNVEEK